MSAMPQRISRGPISQQNTDDASLQHAQSIPRLSAVGSVRPAIASGRVPSIMASNAQYPSAVPRLRPATVMTVPIRVTTDYNDYTVRGPQRISAAPMAETPSLAVIILRSMAQVNRRVEHAAEWILRLGLECLRSFTEAHRILPRTILRRRSVIVLSVPSHRAHYCDYRAATTNLKGLVCDYCSPLQRSSNDGRLAIQVRRPRPEAVPRRLVNSRR